VAFANFLLGPYAKFDPQKVHNSLTAGSLRGPGKLAVPPILFAKSDESEAIGELAASRVRKKADSHQLWSTLEEPCADMMGSFTEV
jgi:hypothetical protein